MYLDLIAKLSPTSKLSGQEQAAVVITGLVVVFLVLAFLVLFVSWFGKLFDKSKKIIQKNRQLLLHQGLLQLLNHLLL